MTLGALLYYTKLRPVLRLPLKRVSGYPWYPSGPRGTAFVKKDHLNMAQKPRMGPVHSAKGNVTVSLWRWPNQSMAQGEDSAKGWAGVCASVRKCTTPIPNPCSWLEL